jgi:ribonuclease P protein component
VYERGFRVTSSAFVLFGLPNTIGYSRLGITATRKSGGAVTRSRMKRVLREIFRQHQSRLLPAMDLVVNVRAGMEKSEFARVESEFLQRFTELARRVRT